MQAQSTRRIVLVGILWIYIMEDTGKKKNEHKTKVLRVTDDEGLCR